MFVFGFHKTSKNLYRRSIQ